MLRRWWKKFGGGREVAARRTYLVTLADSEGNRDVKITDRLGTFVGHIEEGGLEIIEIKPETWVARAKVREVKADE